MSKFELHKYSKMNKLTYEEYKKSLLRIPSQTGSYFFKSQKAVFDSLKKEVQRNKKNNRFIVQ